MIDTAFIFFLSELSEVPIRNVEPLVLAVVSPMPHLRLIAGVDIIQYKLNGNKYAHPDVVDARKIDCLVGRLTTPLGASFIVERDTVVGQTDVVDEAVTHDRD